MKEATGETNMTLVTIVAIGAVLVFATTFLPKILENRPTITSSLINLIPL